MVLCGVQNTLCLNDWGGLWGQVLGMLWWVSGLVAKPSQPVVSSSLVLCMDTEVIVHLSLVLSSLTGPLYSPLYSPTSDFDRFPLWASVFCSVNEAVGLVDL